MLGNGVQADTLIDALEERGVVRRLAEPNLTALSGDTASFLAGGEFPIPVASNLGTITIEFKKFGVGLAFTPTVLGDGVINLKIEPEVSQIDPTTASALNGITIPALIVRRANTTVELRDGQSFAIAGLLQSISTDRPEAAALARRRAGARRARAQRRLPEEGNRPRHHRDAAPGAAGAAGRRAAHAARHRKPANDAEFFLLGQSEITVPMDRRLKGRSDGRRRRSATSSTFPRESAMSRNNRLGAFWRSPPPLLLGACTDMYLDRRDTVSFAAGDAVAVNKVTHMVDPWPARAGDRNIAFDGERMAAAAERYRTNKVTPLSAAAHRRCSTRRCWCAGLEVKS